MRPKEYALSKICVLAFGFGLGDTEFEGKCKKGGIDLESIGFNGAKVHAAYHRQFPLVKRLWNQMNHAAISAVKNGKPYVAGRVEWKMDTVAGSDVLVAKLPNNREVFYHEPAIGVDDRGEPALTYLKYSTDGQRKRIRTWGGTLVQNMCQAIGRDVLVDVGLCIEQTGAKIVMHTHDELVIEGADCDSVKQAMCRPPPWAEGLPLDCDAYYTNRYHKEPLA